MYTKARDEIFDMECKIHRLEDKLLRSKNPYEQMEIQSVLRVRRMQLQKMQWERNGNRRGS